MDIETCVNLISNTTTETELKVISKIDKHKYELNKKLYTKKEFKALPYKFYYETNQDNRYNTDQINLSDIPNPPR